MRKTFLLTALLSLWIASLSLGQTTLTVSNPPAKVGVYDKYEVSFALDSYLNPYDPDVIDVFADFIAPDGREIRVIGFYYEGYGFQKENKNEVAKRQSGDDCWKVRFTPDTPGQWSYVIHATDRNGERTSRTLFFECQAKNAEGFIKVANSQYLKREAFVAGQRNERLFFPIGPNIAWYNAADFGKYQKPFGIYDYQRYFKALSGNANYVRIWLNRYQFLSLYGPEHAGTSDGRPHMYFDNTLNQKDAAELDYIVENAKEQGISLMMNIFNFRDFIHKDGTPEGSEAHPAMPSDWVNSPFNKVLGLRSKYGFFSDTNAIRVTKNLIRYIVARWGYATNVMCWEIWNELANMADGEEITIQEQREMVEWHNQMAEYLHSLDPFQHPISTSLGTVKDNSILNEIFNQMDFVQDHDYQNIQKAKSKEQFSYILFQKTQKAKSGFPDKPFFMGEFAFGQGGTKPTYANKDPWGIDLHNSLWSSAFSGSMGPASFWYWEVLDKQNWYGLFRPMLAFFGSLPILSDSFTAMTTGTKIGNSLVFPNHIETYYMVNSVEDTLLGWSQDTAFGYQSLRRLTDDVGKDLHFVNDGVFDPKGYVYTLDSEKRPGPSSDNNSIVLPIINQRTGTQYLVRWFDAETGEELIEEAATVVVRRPFLSGKRITIEFPSSIRDVEEGRINNTFGDAVFLITKM